MAGRPVSGWNFDLSDDSACARGADDKGRLCLVSFAIMGDAFEQRASDSAKAALRVADRPTGAPGNGSRRDRIRQASHHRHRGPSTAPRPDDQIRRLKAAKQRRKTRRVVLTVRIDSDHRVDCRRDRKHMLEPGDESTSLPPVHVVSDHLIRPARDGHAERRIGRPIVDDHHHQLWGMGTHALDDGRNRVRRLIRRNHARRPKHQRVLVAGDVSSRRIWRSSLSIPCQVATSSASRAVGRSSPALRSSSSRRFAPSIVYFSV